MLELKRIKKTYQTGEVETHALNDISVTFRKQEFVAILGSSGSGKTTCLNIIGGLDRYDAGDLIIKGKSTKDFTDSDWDAYRNNSVGFVFQNYNLISHLSVIANVEMGMTLSGVPKAEKRKRAFAALEKVGLKKHINKNPNQLSGGEMQRVAIARALVNNPEILLCDEPTGALDSRTGQKIMDLIHEIAKEKLVIMVTHNSNIAEKYADRIVRFQDGKITSDSNPYKEHPNPKGFKLKKTSMGFLSALNLSFNNIETKKGRTFLTAFASSIGIIGIALILSLSTGFQNNIDEFQRDVMADFPIMITQQSGSINVEEIQGIADRFQSTAMEEFIDTDKLFVYDPSENNFLHDNIITEEYIEFVNKIDPSLASSIGYMRLVNMNLLRNVDGTILPVSFGSAMPSGATGDVVTQMDGIGLSSYPAMLDESNGSYLEKNYDLLEGKYPTSPTELVLIVDSKNRLSIPVLNALAIQTDDVDSISFEELLDLDFKLVDNNDSYIGTEFGTYIPNKDLQKMYDSKNSLTLSVVGVLRQKEEANFSLLAPGIVYGDDLLQMVISNAMDSNIVKAQKESDFNILTREPITEEEKDSFLSYLGGNTVPFMMMIYPNGFDEKEEVTAYLASYNEDKETEDTILYTDLADQVTTLTGSIIDAITLVLVVFAATSLVVSLIMISIITYISVLERTKEIGILKSLGARKKDIARVFNAETFIIGVLSGILGLVVAWLLTIPANIILYNVTGLSNVANLRLEHATILLVLSTILTVLGGYIPAKMAANKDAVVALRTE